MIKCNSNFLTEVFTEQRDLGISLAEVIEHDELSIHLHPNLNCLRGCAAKGPGTQHSYTLASAAPPTGNSRLHLAASATSCQQQTLDAIHHLLGTSCLHQQAQTLPAQLASL